MPTPDEVEKARTFTFRLPPDLSVMLSEVLAVEDITSAKFLDPVTRPEIERRHQKNIKAIRAMRAAREEARKLREEAPVLANDLGGEG